MRKNLHKRLLALFMALSLCLGMFCTTAFATDAGTAESGASAGAGGNTGNGGSEAGGASSDSGEASGASSTSGSDSGEASGASSTSGSDSSEASGASSTSGSDSGEASGASSTSGSDSSEASGASGTSGSDSGEASGASGSDSSKAGDTSSTSGSDNSDSTEAGPSRAPMLAPRAPASTTDGGDIDDAKDEASESTATNAKEDYIYVYLNAEKVNAETAIEVSAKNPGTGTDVEKALNEKKAELDSLGKKADSAESAYKKALEAVESIEEVPKPDESSKPADFTKEKPQRPDEFSMEKPKKPDILNQKPGTTPAEGQSREEYEQQVADYNKAAVEYNNQVNAYNKAIDDYQAVFTLYLTNAQEYNDALEAYRAAVTEYNDKVAAYQAYFTAYNDAIAKAVTAGAAYESAVTDYNNLVKDDYQKALEAVEKYNSDVAKYNGAAAGANKEYAKDHGYDVSDLNSAKDEAEYNKAVETLNGKVQEVNKDQNINGKPLGYYDDIKEDASLKGTTAANFGPGENWFTIGRVDISGTDLEKQYSSPDDAAKAMDLSGTSAKGTIVYSWEASVVDGALQWTGKPGTNTSISNAVTTTIKAIEESIKQMMQTGDDRYDYKDGANQGQAGTVDKTSLGTKHSVLAHTYKWELKLSDGATDYDRTTGNGSNSDGSGVGAYGSLNPLSNWTWHLDGYVYMQPMLELLSKLDTAGFGTTDKTATLKTLDELTEKADGIAQDTFDIAGTGDVTYADKITDDPIGTVTPDTPPTPPTPPSGGGGNPGGGSNPGGGGNDNPPVDIPEEDPPLVDVPEEDPPLVDIPEEEPPLVEAPEEDPVLDIPEEEPPLVAPPATSSVVITETKTPLAKSPAGVDIVDEAVPLADVPKTGDNTALWIAMALASASALAVLAPRKKENG